MYSFYFERLCSVVNAGMLSCPKNADYQYYLHRLRFLFDLMFIRAIILTNRSSKITVTFTYVTY